MLKNCGRAALSTGVMLALAAAAPQCEAAVDLITALQKAFDQNPRYQAAEAEYRYDLEARPQAVAKLLPQLGVQGSASFNKEHYAGTSSFAEEVPSFYRDYLHIDSNDSYKSPTYEVGLAQALYHPQDFIGLSISDLQLTQAKVALDEARSGLLFKVGQTYLEVLDAQDHLKYSVAQRNALQKELEQDTARHNAGLINDADYAEIKASYAMSEADVAHSQGNLEVALSAFTTITGERFTELKELPEEITLPTPDPDDITPWVSRAVEQNLAVVSSQLDTKIAKLEYDKARASRLPVVDLVGGYTYQHPTGGYPGPHEAIEQQIGIRIKQPIYTGGAIDSSVRSAQAKWDKAQALEDQSKVEAVQQARTAFFQVRSGMQQVPALQEAIEAAETGADAAEVGFRVGTRTAAEMLKAIEQLYQAQAAHSTARYSYLISTLQLKLAVGEISEADLQAINAWLH